MNLRHLWRYLFLVLLLALGLSKGGPLGCGAGSPPVGIPAPVSNLMTLSNPDALGVVNVTGAPGAVDGGALVIGNNLNLGAWWRRGLEWIYPQAFAQAEAAFGTITAGADGSFLMRIDAQIGNVLRFVQSFQFQISPPTDLAVEGGTIALGASPQGVDIDIKNHRAYVSASQDLDGMIFVLPLDHPDSLISFPAPDFTFEDLQGIDDVGVDSSLGKGFVISAAENTLFDFTSSGGQPIPNSQPLSSPQSIDVLDGANLAAIGLADTSISWIVLDTEQNKLSCPFLLRPPNGGSRHLTTPLIEMRKSDLRMINQNSPDASNEVIAVSQFEDGSWMASRTRFAECSDSTDQPFGTTSFVALPESLKPEGLASFNHGVNTLITDAANNQLLVVDFDAGSIARMIAVGKDPRGVAVLHGSNRAYVVNSGDNSLSAVNLENFSTSTHTGVGLSPSEISLDAELNIAVVLSTYDKSVVVVDLDF